MSDTKPVAFLSFVNSDFQHEEGRIAQFRERLADEVSMHTGKDLSIFQDRDDALWKQAWEEHVVLDNAEEGSPHTALLIAFITPRFFRSDQCKNEMEAFLRLEQQLNRNDLVLPLYYVRCPFLDDDAKQGGDGLVDSIVGREHRFDWRELRFQPFSAPEVGKALEELALKIKEYVPDFYIHFSEIGSDPDKRNYIVSNQKLKDAGFLAKRSLDAGIQELLKGFHMMNYSIYKNV